MSYKIIPYAGNEVDASYPVNQEGKGEDVSLDDGVGTEVGEGTRVGLFGRKVGETGGKLFGKGDVTRFTGCEGMYTGFVEYTRLGQIFEANSNGP